jgi:catechol 2,3-dioxygenase-like lactoylglutathione lyase family enzyme
MCVGSRSLFPNSTNQTAPYLRCPHRGRPIFDQLASPPTLCALTDVSGLNMTISMTIRSGVLGHIVLNVADLKKSERFYRTVLGLKVSARNVRTKMTFLSYGREHHDIALMELPAGAKTASDNGVPKLHHFCIYVASNNEIDDLYPVLKRRKIPIVSGPETLEVAGNRSISFLDPDGNRVEIACNVNKFQYDDREQAQPEDGGAR